MPPETRPDPKEVERKLVAAIKSAREDARRKDLWIGFREQAAELVENLETSLFFLRKRMKEGARNDKKPRPRH